ncbi:MAG: hypothetical protein AVDCRST_MAG18-4714, partial [uncultured Thermomicrobiales bacterium]
WRRSTCPSPARRRRARTAGQCKARRSSASCRGRDRHRRDPRRRGG